MSLYQFALDYQKKQERIFRKEKREALREKLWRIKRKAISNLSGLKNQAIENLKSNGVRVFEAKNVAQAQRVVEKLIGKRKLVVKSKSNTLKEIEIKKLAKKNKWQLIETDLGDFLAQLTGEDSGHPVLPALTLSLEKIKKFFKKELEGVEEVVQEVSSQIRQKILSAEIGLTGANAITSQGQIAILENEGNISLVSRIPKRHIIVAGIEKLVFTLKEALHVCRCAAIWGTGQDFTSYLSIITSPSKTADIQNKLVVGAQGAKEVDLILIDDWRSRLIGGPFEEILYCINCGACFNCCPYYLVTGEKVESLNEKKAASFCTLCGACDFSCPAKINLGKIIKKVREKLAKENKVSKETWVMIKNLRRFGNPFGRAKFDDKIPKKLYCC